jgi:type IV secretion system protein VirB9
MTVKLSFAAFVLLGCGSVASAAPDSRIRTLAYNPEGIVRILGKTGIQSTNEFASDERIENVAVGDSSAWQITPNRRASLLFVKPLVARSRTNMTVVTDKRTYMFDLVAGDKTTTPVYALKFSYPKEKQSEPVAKTAQQQTAATATQAPATLTADKLHFDWKSKGHGKLLPARMFDDGKSLYLSWSRETPLPASLTLSEDRKEGPVNYRMSGDYIVITPIPQNVVLRYGSKSATLWPTRRIIPAPAVTPTAAGTRLAIDQQPATARPAPAQAAATSSAEPASAATVKLTNVAALYSDKLTDADNEH